MLILQVNLANFNWFYLIYAFIIFLIFISVFIIFNYLRKNTLHQLNDLLYLKGNYLLYQELLNNNRLKLLFRKQMIDIMRLDGYLLAGNDEKIVELIDGLDDLKLEPREKLNFYQKRFSYFVEKNNQEEAKVSLKLLKTFLAKEKDIKFQEILKEAVLVYDIYITHNTKLIPELIEKTKVTKDKIVKGITEFRIAKLYYYENNPDQINIYLNKAKENVKGTYWYPIVLEAKKNHTVLAIK